YTPNTGYSGADSFTYKANDGKLDSNVAKVSITVASASVNKAPVADDQAVTIPAGTPGAVTLTAIDPDGNSLTFAAVSNPTNGKLSGTAPSLTYTPNTGYSGADSFTYKANDGKLDSNVAKVSITVTSESTNPPPVPTEKATVKFVVTDDKKGNPIKNAKVSLGKITIKTDKTGMAIFTNVVPGSYNYEISKDHDLETKDSISVTGDQIISVKLISDEEEHDQKEHHEEVKNKKSTTQSRYNRGLKNEENDHEEE
ncbi:MAG: cadherin-like domain-containing protein, partial [Candidatus Methanoperedens sp.]|nr:cadherin-like domain-containing protein [Candidatus Methanoperedens sp.]